MGRKKMSMIGVVVLVVALGAVSALVVYPAQQGATNPSGDAHATVKPQAPGEGPVYKMKERVLNLADKGVRRYLKIAVAMELKAPAGWDKVAGEEKHKKAAHIEAEMESKAALLNDALTTVISAKTSEQLASPEGKESLRAELRERFNTALGHEGEIVFVYFQDFLMQ